MEKIKVNIISKSKNATDESIISNTVEIERFSTLKDLAQIYFNNAEGDTKKYVAAFVDKKIKEMNTVLDKACEVEFISLNSVIGNDMYKRSLTLMMLKAFSDVLKENNKYIVNVLYSLGKGYFCTLTNEAGDNALLTGELGEDVLARVKARMKEIVAADELIAKEVISTDEAMNRFNKIGMQKKSLLFKYRRVSKVNIYKIGNYEDYFYGYMVPSTGYLSEFDIVAYDDGFVLVMPDKATLKCSDEYVAPKKLYTILRRTDEWGKMLDVSTVGDMNEKISAKEMNDLILVQEALQEKYIAEIAEKIINEEKKIILIAGPSSSGKTTFSHRLSVQLKAHGMKPHPVELDNYFVNREQTPRDENGKYDFECIEAMDLNQFNSDMGRLLKGETVEIPRFNFSTGERYYKGDFLKLEQGDVLVCEGIHALNPKMTVSLPDESKFKIYISALTSINIDEHNRVPTTDSRLLRRIVRDARTRGNDARATIGMWESVRRGEEKNIFPFQEEADVMFNSALIYELAAIKQYAEPLLFAVPRGCEEYYEAKRLLKFLDYFLGIDVSLVPQNSIIKEFIGGGCFNV